jgi:hypothetical protein
VTAALSASSGNKPMRLLSCAGRSLGARRLRPRATKCDNEALPPHVDCHVSLPWDHAHAMEGQYHGFDTAIGGSSISVNSGISLGPVILQDSP